MPNESNALRNKTRRVKDHILTNFLRLADKVDKGESLGVEGQVYTDLLMVFAKSVLPRTTEITGEEGEAIKIAFDAPFKAAQQTSGDSTVESQV